MKEPSDEQVITPGQMRELAEKLIKKYDNWNYDKMANAFMNLVLLHQKSFNYRSYQDIENTISSLNPKKPSKRDIKAVTEEKLRSMLYKLYSLDIHQERNKVVHKYGYRPHRNQTKKRLNQVSYIISGFREYYKNKTLLDQHG